MKTTAPGQSALLILDVIDILNSRHIPYAIIGAFAASFYGVVRASLDADAVISIRTSQESEKLCKALRAEGLKVEYREGDSKDPIAQVINIQDNFRNRVDLLAGIRGMNDDAFGRVEEVRFMGVQIRIISREDFIAMKVFAGSPKDIQDVLDVLQASREAIDLAQLKKIIVSFGPSCVKKLKNLLREQANL